MLFTQAQLHGIQDGSITLAFRTWAKPAAKAGSLHKTAIGLVEIISVEAVLIANITASEAQAAGYAGRSELLAVLAERPGTTYKIALRYHSPDPRLALREQRKLSANETASLLAKLARLDAASSQGAWTRRVLAGIAEHPHLRAADLAKALGKDKEWLKLNVRKLKNLGLTISHHPGYEISPLGKVILKKLKQAEP